MGSALPTPRISVEDYLAADEIAERPSEYFDGEVFTIVDATPAHAQLTVSVGAILRELLKGTPCRPYAGMRLRVSDRQYVYPDVTVVCGKPVTIEVRQSESLVNPKVVIEILSPSTADFDYGGKFALYRKVESLEEYILVAQDQALVEIFRRTPDGNWLLKSYRGLDQTAPIESLEIAIPLAELYEGIDFPPPSEPVEEDPATTTQPLR